jgi:AAA15 family ATPase/GTPase
MYISRITITNFKRFRKLTIDLSALKNLPKLVLITGTNGSGKSSLFDAFEWIAKPAKDGIKNESTHYEDTYYVRFTEEPTGLAGHLPVVVQIDFNNNQFSKRKLDFVASPKNVEEYSGVRRKNLFYGRSALRQKPRTENSSEIINVVSDTDRPRFYTDSDNRFQNDILLWKKQFFAPLNDALQRVFGNEENSSLRLISVSPPSNKKPAELKFKKGSTLFSYDLLSNGEKEVLGILLNLLVRRKNFQDTIYFIDELDIHLNTKLQYDFLKEITENWIPENCQLWTASHSLGFIKYAKDSEDAAIISFDKADFDFAQIINPQSKESSEVYEVAIPQSMISEIFTDKLLTFCENEDVRFYNSFGLPKRLFLPAKDKNDVYFAAKNNNEYFGIMDKDFLTPQEINLIRQKVPNLCVLKYYSIESYFYHPENLSEAIENFDAESYYIHLKQQKYDLYEQIIYGLKQARDSYKVLGFEKIKLKNAKDEIIKSLKSDVFEEFYPYLDMKKQIARGNFNISETKLIQTKWIKSAISNSFTES